MILNSRMAFFEAQGFINTHSAKCYALVQFYMITNFCSFANDNTGAMINKKMIAYYCAGMNIDAGFRMSVFSKYARQQRNFQL